MILLFIPIMCDFHKNCNRYLSFVLLGVSTVYLWTPPEDTIIQVYNGAEGMVIMEIYDLQCESCTRPMGIGESSPRLSWKLRDIGRGDPSACRVYVSADPANPAKHAGDVWDSGIIAGDPCFCDCGGDLESCGIYYWCVSLCDARGEWQDSDTASFEMGLLDPGLWQGRWIGSPAPGRYAGYFRRVVSLDKKAVRARAYLATEGFSELWINGAPIGDSVLDPANTDYAQRLLYITHDITDRLRPGDNAIGIVLNNGWSRHARFLLQVLVWFGDGSRTGFCSEFGSWVLTISPILSATIYSGVVYNALYEKPEWNLPDSSFEKNHHRESWRFFCDKLPINRDENPAQYDQYARAFFDVLELPAPGGRLESQLLEPIRPMGTIRPVAVKKTAENVYTYSFAQNFTGWVRIEVSGKPGDVVTVRHSEILHDDGTLNMDYLRVSDPTYPLPMQTDTYILKGEGTECCEPKFTYHGFRYISIEGIGEELSFDRITGIIVHSAVEQAGRFECGNPLLNRIQDMVLWTERSNLFGIPTDCPQRSERQGWLNDLTARSEETVYNFNARLLFSKFLRDIQDTQDDFSGAIGDTAPFRRGNRPADPVSSSYLIIAHLIYRHYGDERPIRRHYEGMKKWTEFLLRNSHDGIVTYSFYGDWASPVGHCRHNGLVSPASAITPGSFISSGYLYMNVCLMAEFAGILNQADDAERFAGLRRSIRNTLNRTFCDPETGDYAGGSQGANVFALHLGIVPKKKQAALIRRIVSDIVRHDYHLTTGNLMTKYILEVLCDHGETDIAYQLAVQTTYPSWGYMISNGATTIWERWEYETGYGMNSHNHAMYGSVSAWFYKYLAGISPVEPGYKVFQVKPHVPAGLDRVDAEVRTVCGTAGVRWEKTGEGLRFEILVPEGTRSFAHVPVDGVNEEIRCGGELVWNGRFLNGSPDVTGVAADGRYAVFSLPHGRYRFDVGPRSAASGEKHAAPPAALKQKALPL